MQAAADGDVSSIKILLAFGANPNALNEQNENPLGFAITWKQIESVRLLLDAGAAVNDTFDPGPSRTQLDWVELSNWREAADLIRAFGGKRYSELIQESNASGQAFPFASLLRQDQPRDGRALE